MLLSLACIAKNEEDMIGGLLSSVRGLVDEMVVVDTGSTDNTVAVAEGLGARVIRSTWQGSFAQARNESVEHCRGKWIIYLDADERAAPTGFKAVRRMLAAAREDGFYLTLINYADLDMKTAAENIKVFRVFRNRPEFRFSGTIHEQVLPEVTAKGRGVGLLPLEVGHVGYVAGVIQAKNKQARNLAMCEEAYRAPHANPMARFYALFNLAREYQNTGNLAQAVDSYRELLVNREVHNEPYFSIAAFNICNCLVQLPGREKDALELADRFLAVMPDYAELWFLRGTFLYRLQRREEALQSHVKCLAQNPDNPRYISRMPRLREMAWLAVARIKKENGDLVGHLAALHKLWEEKPAPANRGILADIVRLLLPVETPGDIVHRYLARLPGMDEGSWLSLREVFLCSRAYAAAREISATYLKPRNRSVFQFLRSIDDNICADGPVDLEVLRAKGRHVLPDALLRAPDRELAALVFLAGGPDQAPWPVLAEQAEAGSDAGQAVRDLAGCWTGEGPPDRGRAVTAVYTLLTKYRQLPNASLTARLQEVLVGLGEEAETVVDNLRRMAASE